MAQNIEFSVSLGLQAAEGQVNHLRKILSEAVKIDSSAFRGLSQALQKAENDVARLKSQMNNAFQSASGSKKFLASYDKLFESLATIGNRFGFLKESEMIFSPENAEVIKNARVEMAQLSNEIQQIKSGKVGKLFEDDSIQSIHEVREAASMVGATLSKVTFQDFSQKIHEKAAEIQKDLENTTKQIELFKQAANNTNLSKDSIFSQMDINKLIGNTTDIIDKKGASDLRTKITDIYEKFGLKDIDLSKTIRAGTGIDQLFVAEEERIRASTDKYADVVKEQQDKVKDILEKFDKEINKNTPDGKRANANSKIEYIENIKKQFSEFIKFSEPQQGKGFKITEYINQFKKELTEGIEKLSKEDIAKVLQLKVQEIFSQVSTKTVITDSSTFKAQVETMLQNAFGSIDLKGLTEGIKNGMGIDDALDRIISNVRVKFSSLDVSELEQKVQQYEAALNTLKNADQTLKTTEQDSTGSLKEKEAAFQALAEEVTKYVAAQLRMTTGQVQEVLHNDTNAANQGRTALEKYIESLTKLQQKQQALGNIQSAVNRWMGFWQVLNMTKSAINDMKQHLQELDTVMTQISVVTNFSQSDLWGQISQYSEIARSYGVAIKGVYEVSQIYYQQGLQQNDVMTLTTETLKMARIAGLDYATAADYMTTAIRGFKLEMQDAAHVTDVFSALAATTASSTEEIATAISKTAASAQAVGASFEATSAMMATMIATTRESATNIGTALKSVISRYGEMTSDPSKTVDSEGEEMSLNRVDRALQTVGITIHDTAGQFRDFDDVMLELMEKWDSLDSLSQRYIATLMAGNRQQSRFLALVSNVDEYKKALQTAMDSEGTGELQTLKTLDSIDAKLEKMKVTVQEFYTSSGLEQLYKNVIDTITNIISAANSLPKQFEKFPGLALSLGLQLVSTIKSVMSLIIAELQMGLNRAKGENTNFLVGMVQQFQQKGREAGQAAGQEITNGMNSGLQGFFKSKSFIQIINMIGSAAQLAGSTIFTKGLAAYGASSSHDEDIAAINQMKTGSFISALGSVGSSAAMGFATAGPWGALAGAATALVGQIPTLITAFGTNTETLARKIELDKKAETKAKENLAKDKGEEKSLQTALNQLNKLKVAQYDSAEAAKEYIDYMNQLGDQYPNLIESINQTGNAIISTTKLENELADARLATANATITSLKAELKTADDQRTSYQALWNSMYGLNDSFDLESLVRANIWHGIGNTNYQGDEYARVIYGYNQKYNENLPIDVSLFGHKQKNLDTITNFANAPKFAKYYQDLIEEENELVFSGAKQSLQTSLTQFLSEHKDINLLQQLGYESLDELMNSINDFGSLKQTVADIQNIASEYIDKTDNFIQTTYNLLKQAEIEDGIQNRLNQMLNKDDIQHKNSTILQNYIKLMSFIYSGIGDALPSEEIMNSLEKWILENRIEADKLLQLDYSQYRNFKEIGFSSNFPEEAKKAFEKSFDDSRDVAVDLYIHQLEQIFGKDNLPFELDENQFNNKTLSAIQADLSKYSSMLSNGNLAGAEAYLNNILNIYNFIGQLEGPEQAQIYSVIKDLDLSNPEELRTAAETLTNMGGKFAGLAPQFIVAAQRWATNAATLLEQLASSAQETAKSIESSTSDMSKVFKYSEALEKAQALMDANKGVKFDELFTYDKDLGGYVKTAKAFQLEMAELQNQQIEGIQQAITDTTVILPKALKSLNYDRLASDYVGSKHTNQDIAQRAIREGKQTLSSLTGVTDGATLDRLWIQYTQMMQEFDALEETDKDWSTFVDKYIQEHGDALQLQLDEKNNMSSQMASLQLKSFDYASIVSGKGTAQSKETLKALLMSIADSKGENSPAQQIDKYFDIIYPLLIQGKIDEYNKQLEWWRLGNYKVTEGEANRARFEAFYDAYQKIAGDESPLWTALDKETQDFLINIAGITEADYTADPAAAAQNLWTVIAQFISDGVATMNEVAESIAALSNKAYGNTSKEKSYQLLDKYKDGLTAEELQQLQGNEELFINTKTGKLTTEAAKYLTYDNGKFIAKAGQDAASVLAFLANALEIAIATGTDEYKQTIKESIDAQITENAARDQDKIFRNTLKEIFSGAEGDQINIAGISPAAKNRLKDAGYSISGDILTIGTEQAMNNAAIALENQIKSGDQFWKVYDLSARDVSTNGRQLEASMAKNAAFEGIVGEQFNQSAANALSMALQNTTEYADVQSLMEEMGFRWDEAAQIWKANAVSIEKARAKIRQSWLNNEIDNETYFNLIASLNETANAIDPKTKQDNVLQDILSNYTNATETMRAAFITNFIDYMSAQGTNVNQFFKADDNGTYDVDVIALKSFLDSIGFKYDEAAMSEIQAITDTYLSNISTASNYAISGASSLADVEAFKQSYADITGKVLDENAFQYNTLTQSFILDPAVMQKYVNAQKQLLLGMGYTEEFVNTYITDQTDKVIQAGIELNGFLNADSSKSKNDEANKLFQQIQNLSNYQDIAAQAAIKYFEHTVDSVEEEFEAIISILSNGGQDAVDLLQQIKPDASQEELELAFNSQINKLNDVMSQVGDLVVGQFVGTESKLYQILNRAGAVDESGVIKAGFDMIEVYAAIYAEMLDTEGSTTAGLNEAYAKLLTAQDQKNIDITDALSNAGGMTYEALGVLLTKYSEQSLEEFIASAADNGIYRTGFGKIQIKDWNTFAESIFGELTPEILNSQEYISAFKAYNDGIISMNKQVEKAIVEEVKQIGSAKAGDWLNFSQLFQILGNELSDQFNEELKGYGAILDNGILKLDEDANLLGISQTLQAMMDSSDITEGIEEVHDLVLQILKSYAEAITKGIQGGLSNVERQDLINKAWDLNIGEIDFIETADGFKLVETSAIDLYYALKNIDSLHAGQIFDALREELEKTRDEFDSVASLTNHITKIRNGTYQADSKISNARKEQYEAELQIAEEILAVRSTTEDDSFKFMEQDIPSGQNNPLNYWNNWKTAFDSIKEGKRTGKMDYKDFYNLITEMGNLSDMMGGKGIQIGKDLEVTSENVAELIAKAGKNMEVAQDGSLKVNLKGIGVDFAASANEMESNVDEGIDAIAQSQINMLDGVIQLLETIVAMEKLGDLDSDSDMKITLPELLLDENGNEDGKMDETETYIEKYGSKYDSIRKTLISIFENSDNKDLVDAYKNVKYKGFSIQDILTATETDLKNMGITGKDLAKLVDGLWQLSMNDGWDINDPVKSLYELISSIDDFKLSVESDTHSLTIGSDGLEFSIDWDSQAVKDRIAAAAKAAGIEPGKTPEEIIQMAKEALKQTENNQPLTLEQNYLLKVANGDIKVKYDDNGEPTSWVVGNQRFNSYKDSVIASDLYKATGKQITQTEIKQGKASVIVKKGTTDITVESTGEGANWIDPDTSDSYKSWDALQDAMFKRSQEFTDLQNPTEQEIEATKKKWKIKMGFEVAPTIEGSLDSATAAQVKEIQSEIQAALESGEWGEVQVKASEIGIQLNWDKNGPTYAQQQAILEYFGLKDTNILSDAFTSAFKNFKVTESDVDTSGIEKIQTDLDNATISAEKLAAALGALGNINGNTTINVQTVGPKPEAKGVTAGAKTNTTSKNQNEDKEETRTDISVGKVSGASSSPSAKNTTVAASTNTTGILSGAQLDNMIKTISLFDFSNLNKIRQALIDYEKLGVSADATIEESFAATGAEAPTDYSKIVEKFATNSIIDWEAFVKTVDEVITQTGKNLEAAEKHTAEEEVTSDETSRIAEVGWEQFEEERAAASIQEPSYTIVDAETYTLGEDATAEDAMNFVTMMADYAKQVAQTSNNNKSGLPDETVKAAIQTILDKDNEEVIGKISSILGIGQNTQQTGTTENKSGISEEEKKKAIELSNQKMIETFIEKIWPKTQNEKGTVTATDLDTSNLQDETIEVGLTIDDENKGISNIENSISDMADTISEASQQVSTDAQHVGENISISIAQGVQSGESNVINALGSTRTHIEELGTAAEKIFTNIKTILRSIQEHISITGEISFETPFGTLGTKSGFRGENGVITLSVEGQKEIQEVKEEAEKPVSFDVNAVDGGVAGQVAEILAKLPKTYSIAIETSGGNSNGGEGKTPPRFRTTNGIGGSTGNFAMAQGTLMGELGPELVVSNGRYFVAGQNGAEFVNLDSDAIVFNHLQTEQLLKNGISSTRGKAVTNEHNAVAFAAGNTGPAMASASAALNALKQLRSMWESLLGASVSDLAGGGGGGGGGDKVVDPKAWIDTVERWYNLTQEIAKLEKQITHEEALRTKIQSDFQKNGEAYYKSQKASLDAIRQQIKAQEQLNLSREEYYDRRVEALKTAPLGKLYTFDNEGQLQFRKDISLSAGGKTYTNAMEFLTNLYGFDENQKANYTNKQKYEILQNAGFGDYMLYKDGVKIKADNDNNGEVSDEEWETFYETTTEAFRDRMDEYASATQSLWDEIQEGKDQVLELMNDENEILNEMRENQLNLEDAVLNAIVESRQREIDTLQDEREALEESTGKFIDGLSKNLQKEQDLYQNQENKNELNRLKRQRDILARSGGSAAQISGLDEEIYQKSQDMYFDMQQKQIDAIQEASDLELERLDNQINIMTETLEYQKKYGLLWEAVYDQMSKTPAEIVSFLQTNTEDYWNKSPLASVQAVNDWLFQADQWAEYRKDVGVMRDLMVKDLMKKDYDTYNAAMVKEFGANYDPTGKYKAAFEAEYNNSYDITKASTAARKLYHADKKAAEEAEAARKAAQQKQQQQQVVTETGNQNSSLYVKSQSGWKSNNSQHWKENTWSDGSITKFAVGAHNKNKKISTGNTYTCYCDICNHYMGIDYKTDSTSNNTTTRPNNEKLAKTVKISGGIATGGLVKARGVYELAEEGTEAVFNAEQTRILRENILSNKPNSLISLLATYNEAYKDGTVPSTSNSQSLVIESAVVNMNVSKISNDYDARRAGEQALEEMMRIARKTGATNSIRR